MLALMESRLAAEPASTAAIIVARDALGNNARVTE
jgi:hypothetical protein